MNKRQMEKIYKKRIKKLENKALSKLKERYKVYIIKKGKRKNDVIIHGLEDWKIQFEYFGDDVSVMMHPYSIIDSFKYTDVYISMVSVDDNIFNLLDNIINNKKYHLGCAWMGSSTSQEEGIKKYNSYMNDYNKHSEEVKNIKVYIDNYLEELSSYEDVKEVVLYRSSDSLYIERFGVFVFAKDISDEVYDKLYNKISNGFKIGKYNPRDEIRSRSLLPGRGVSYKFSGIYIGKDETEYRKRIGKDIYKSYKKTGC